MNESNHQRHFHYKPMVFDACDADGSLIYHTNVLMCIATDFVLIDALTAQRIQRTAAIILSAKVVTGIAPGAI